MYGDQNTFMRWSVAVTIRQNSEEVNPLLIPYLEIKAIFMVLISLLLQPVIEKQQVSHMGWFTLFLISLQQFILLTVIVGICELWQPTVARRGLLGAATMGSSFSRWHHLQACEIREMLSVTQSTAVSSRQTFGIGPFKGAWGKMSTNKKVRRKKQKTGQEQEGEWIDRRQEADEHRKRSTESRKRRKGSQRWKEYGRRKKGTR